MKSNKAFAPIIIVAIVAAVTVVFGGGGYLIASSQEQKKAEVELAKELEKELIKQKTLPTVSGDTKTVEEIRAIAEPLSGTAKIVNIELENEDAGLVYKVKLDNGNVLFFDAVTGKQIFDPSNDDEAEEEDNEENEAEEEDEIPSNFVATITIAQARAIAENRLPGRTVKKIELEMEEGVGVYSVRFTDSSKVDVNAKTGAIVKVEDEQLDSNDDSNDSSEEDSEDESEDTNDDSEDNSGSN